MELEGCAYTGDRIEMLDVGQSSMRVNVFVNSGRNVYKFSESSLSSKVQGIGAKKRQLNIVTVQVSSCLGGLKCVIGA